MDWKTSDFGTADPEDPLIASFAGTSISPERTSTSPPEVASDSVGPVEPVYSRPSMETPPQQRILQPLDDSGQGYSIYIVATEKFQESGKTPYVVYTIETKVTVKGLNRSCIICRLARILLLLRGDLMNSRPFTLH
jgi:hypothetical protein